MSSWFTCVIKRLYHSWWVSGDVGVRQVCACQLPEELLHPPSDGDRKRMIGELAVRGEQLEVLFPSLSVRQLFGRFPSKHGDLDRSRRQRVSVLTEHVQRITRSWMTAAVAVRAVAMV